MNQGLVLAVLFWLVIGLGFGWSGISQISEGAGTAAAGGYVAVSFIASIVWDAAVGSSGIDTYKKF